ncbi:unnamed protein product [Phytophthora fragariaefolia]|uniref:Unnamed protein product n=1 Tax=Phytophthora fragariaefolia TaxID=1490495 RepID=A0A9W6TNN3_9STRA|nr:unnamed protein product [Phytophthora fragariaefolia]
MTTRGRSRRNIISGGLGVSHTFGVPRTKENNQSLTVRSPSSKKGEVGPVTDSLSVKHQTDYVFDVASLFFTEISGHQVSVEKTVMIAQPEQKNCFDCGIYMLYCMNRITQFIVKHYPETLAKETRALTSKCTAPTREKIRASLRKEFEKQWKP